MTKLKELIIEAIKEVELKTPKGEVFTCANASGFQSACINQLAEAIEDAIKENWFYIL